MAKFIKLYLLGINIFFLTKAAAAPSKNHQKSLSDDFNPIISLLCSTNNEEEPCWNSLVDSSYILEQAGIINRQEPRRTQMIRGINSLPWNNNNHGTLEKLDYSQRNAQQQQLQSNRLAKKDVFMSRGWGAAGGLPFSVLYMNAHNSRNNHPTNINSVDSSSSLAPSSQLITSTQTRNNAENPPTVGTKNIMQNYRVALRNNKPSNQTRRQYSIIPQLFISYGWGGGPHEN